jgi:O-antigen/teichoic acid export membrane protein
MMERRELERTAWAYTHLRGLTAIPGGLVAIVLALGNWEAGPFASPLVVIASVAVLAAAYLAIERGYRRRYGSMTPAPDSALRSRLAFWVVIALVSLGSTVMYELDLAINPLAIVTPIAFLASLAISRALRPHTLVIWGAVLVAGLLPIWHGPPDPGNVALVMCGLAWIAGGVLDHLAFTRTFSAPVLDA